MRVLVCSALVLIAVVASACAGSREAEEADTSSVQPSAVVPTPSILVPTASPLPSPTSPRPSPTPQPEARERFALLPQPAGVDWPTLVWPRGELPSYIDAEELETLMASTFENGAFGEIHALVLVVGGELVLERYGNGYLGGEPHPSFSVSKSVAHALLGVLVRTEDFDISAPLQIQEWATDDRSAITPDMLLRMSSGLEWNEAIEEQNLYFGAADSGIGDLLERHLDAPPDTVFNYNTASTALLGQIMGDEVGTGEQFDEWAHQVLFDRLGIDSARLSYDSEGYWLAGTHADMTARDMARFGLLYLRDGVWDGERILPPGWVDYGRTATTSSEYGAGFWVDELGGFAAIGFGGQKIVIAPDLDLVVVMLARDFDGARSNALLRRFGALFDPDASADDS